MRNVLLLLGVFGVTRISFAASGADAAFESAAKAFIEDYLRIYPEEATELGDHRYDDRLGDYSTSAVAAQIEAWRKHLAALDRIEAGALGRASRIDARIMRVHLEA